MKSSGKDYHSLFLIFLLCLEALPRALTVSQGIAGEVHGGGEGVLARASSGLGRPSFARNLPSQAVQSLCDLGQFAL